MKDKFNFLNFINPFTDSTFFIDRELMSSISKLIKYCSDEISDNSLLLEISSSFRLINDLSGVISNIFQYLKFNFFKLTKFDKLEISVNLSFRESLFQSFSKFNSSSFINDLIGLISVTLDLDKSNIFKLE